MKTEPDRSYSTRTWRTALCAGVMLVLPGIALAAETQEMLPTTIPSYAGMIVAIVLVVTFLNGLFVAADTAIELLRSSHVKIVQNGQSERLQALIDGKPQYVAACTLGSQTMRAWMMILSFVPAPSLAHWYEAQNGITAEWWHVLVAGIVITLPVAAVNVIFGELVPKSYAAQYPHRVALRLYRMVRTTALVFAVPGRVLTGIANLVTKRFGASASFSIPNLAEEEIKSMVESAQEMGEIEEQEKELVHAVFEFGDTIVREVMTPRVDLDSAPITASIQEIMKIIVESGHSRIPLYEETDDEILGLVHAKDLMIAEMKQADQAQDLRTFLRPVIFVPENKPLHDLLREMQTERVQMAIVQDEFGGTAGVVTIEDIVEELLGDIVDEYDTDEKPIKPAGNAWDVEGKVNLYDLNNEIGTHFESEEFDTLGGYVFGLFGRQPKPEESYFHEGYKFTVTATDARRIVRVRVEKTDDLATQVEELIS